MASTWTTNNAIEKIADGEKTDTWGQITNRNFDILDRATSGVGTIDLSSSGAAHTLSTTDSTVGDSLDDGQYRVLVLSGATEACTITVSPNDASKFYLVDNDSGYDVTFSQGTGANVTISNGTTGVIYCDGAGAGAAVKAIIDETTLAALGVLTADANGVVTFDNGITEEFTAVTSSSNSTTVNLHDGTVFSHTLTENTTFTFSNSAVSGKASGFTLKIVQDASASGYTVTWPTAVDWPRGTTPTLTDTASAVDQFIFYTHDGGTTWYGFVSGKDLG